MNPTPPLPPLGREWKGRLFKECVGIKFGRYSSYLIGDSFLAISMPGFK